MSSDPPSETWSRRRFLAGLGAAGAAAGTATHLTGLASASKPMAQQERASPRPPDFGDLSAFDEAAAARLDRWLAEQVRLGLAPSLSLAVVRRGEVVHTGAFGLADVMKQRAATPRTVYPVASLTKMFTATLLMMLVEEGVVALDDPVKRTLRKGFPLSSDSERGGRITFRHLATHTSGLGGIGRAVRADAGSFETLDAKRFEELLGATKLSFEPGRAWQYSNLGYGLLGRALGRAGGERFEDLVRTRILEPLKLGDTWFIDTGDTRWKATARGYYDGVGREPCSPVTLERQMAASTGLVSTASDVARLLAAHLPGGPDTLLGPEARREMRALYRVPDSQGYLEQGIGWEFTVVPALGHLPKKGAKSSEGFRSYVVFSPGHDTGVTLLFNRNLGVNSGDVARAVLWGAVGAPA